MFIASPPAASAAASTSPGVVNGAPMRALIKPNFPAKFFVKNIAGGGNPEQPQNAAPGGILLRFLLS